MVVGDTGGRDEPRRGVPEGFQGKDWWHSLGVFDRRWRMACLDGPSLRVIKSKNRVFEISRNGMDWLAEIGKQTSAVLDDTGKAIGLHLLCHCAGPQWSRAPLLLQAHGLG